MSKEKEADLEIKDLTNIELVEESLADAVEDAKVAVKTEEKKESRATMRVVVAERDAEILKMKKNWNELGNFIDSEQDKIKARITGSCPNLAKVVKKMNEILYRK